MNGRAERLAQSLNERDVDVLLVSGQINVRYLTGYTGSNGIALVGPNTRTFVTDFRYVEQAATEVDASFQRIRAPLELLQAVEEVLPDGTLRLGFEDGQLTVREHARLRELMSERIELVPAGSPVEEERLVKEPGELESLRAATALADDAFEALIQEGLLGRTERELAVALEHAMLMRGARRASFDSIVAAGSQSALPHGEPRDVKVRAGDMVVIDWGAELSGYHSDCTRTVAVGEPGAEARQVYDLVLRAQLAGLEAVRSAAATRDVDGVARQIIQDAGHGEHFGHGLGHGVGLDIHEPPRLSQRSDETLKRGSVVSVEPGVYLPGRFGVRIEDLVIVGDEGPEIMTGISKELRIVD